MGQDLIRNFSIVAHIDHGKSTLADRILEITGAVQEREMQDQLLDSMDIERERGITIKAQAVRVPWEHDGRTYQLNLIDTPGHVDFTYEVSRSLAACEGALLVVDASQGIEAQTGANAHLAIDNVLEIVPVVNKVDLPAAYPDEVAQETAEFLGDDAAQVVRISAKSGLNVGDVLDAIVERVPPPAGDPAAPARALVFDSVYDQYRGVVAYVRVVDGELTSQMTIRSMATGQTQSIEEVGVMAPQMTPTGRLGAGEVGYVITGIKDVAEVRVGDTFNDADRPASEALAGYVDVKPMVFAGLFPSDGEQYKDLRDALAKLRLNDASLVYEPESSQALGFGFRCGFLGLLHMDVVRERLERESDLDLIATTPNVLYDVLTTAGEAVEVRNPSDMPPATTIESVEEPYVRATVIMPKEFVGTIMELCQDRRGDFERMDYLSPTRVQLAYALPLAEIVLDFYDQLKSRTKGYASFDYEMIGYRSSNLAKVDILLNGEPVDALSIIVHRDKAYEAGRALVERLRTLIPRQFFDVPVQAAIGSRVIARETIKAKRKDVLSKCYGGDITRKRKLLEKQKKGKKNRMKYVGAIEVPQ
ncbi:MAG: translation elongation factor 4 [Actinomycetota bacterium]